MIELVQSPDRNRVIADGNDTNIILQANANPGFFVRVKVFIDGSPEPFLEQGWSKDENGICEFNLKHLYYAYFRNETTCDYTTGFHSKPGLFKKVQITAEEFAIGAQLPVHSLELPEFFLIKNLKPVQFDDEKELDFLGLPQQNIKVDRSTGIVFPLYLRAGISLKMSVLNSLNQELFSETLVNYPAQVAQYELNFADLNLTGEEFVFVKFSTSAASIQRKIVFTDDSIYRPKTVFYQNNFGLYISACLFGRREETNSLSPKSYAQQDGTEVTYDVEDIRELELNSGYGYKEVTELVHAIATSIDVRMQLEGYWERVKNETKKVTRLIDNQFIYGEALKFSRLNIPNFTNSNTYAMVPEVQDIIVTGDENADIEISKATFLSAYSAIQPATILQIREVPVNGKLSFEDSQGVKALSDMVANDPSIIPYNIPMDSFIKLIYKPDQRKAGAPLDDIDFKMGTQVIKSNTAQINFMVNDIPDSDLPPEIILNSIKYISLDSSNNGSGVLDATINVADGHGLEILWEVLNGAPITIPDPSLEDPTINITNANPDTTYQVRVTATDTTNGLSSFQVVDINTSSFSVKVEKINYTEAANTEQVDFYIYDGMPGALVTIKFSVYMYTIVYGGARYVLYNYLLPDEEIKYSGSEEIELQLDANGEATIPCQITNMSTSEVMVEVELISAVAPQIVDSNFFKVSESFIGEEPTYEVN